MDDNKAIVPPDAPLDIGRFRELADGDPKTFVQLIDLYLSKTTEQLGELKKALRSRSAPSIERVSHSLVGSSLMVGMMSLVPILRELEECGERHDMEKAARLFEQLSMNFKKIEIGLKKVST